MLFSGNSNSLAHLVDNEIPLSQMDGPSHHHSQTHLQQSRRFRHHKQRNHLDSSGDELDDLELGTANGLTLSSENLDDDDVVVVGNTEVVAAVAAIAATNKARERHNLSDSYNNLFNGDFDATLSNGTTPVTSPLSEIPMPLTSAGNGANLLAAAMMGGGIVGGASATANNTLPKSISQSENMYSNIPNVAATSGNNAHKESGNHQDNSNMQHVYSNLIDERSHHTATTNNNNNNLVNTNSNISQSVSHTHNPLDLSSTLLCDDLDLDDPVSILVQHQKGSAADKHKYNFTSVPDVLTTAPKTLVSSSSATDNVKLQKMSSGELSSSRLRILHDTTMIDTALDLDSLDDASLANTSQSCLVKTQPNSSSSPPPIGFKV